MPASCFLMRYFHKNEFEALSPFAYYCWAAGALFLAIITLDLSGSGALAARPCRPILRGRGRGNAPASEGVMTTIEVMPARLTREETEDLKRAIACLEGTSFAQRLTDAIGRPIGALSRSAPAPVQRARRARERGGAARRAEARATHHRP